jgi:HTH-type transcriptional regulator / antitoxin HigA
MTKVTGRIDPKLYGRLLAKVVPRPPENDTEHDVLVAELMRLDELGDPTPEQTALAELLTVLVQHYENRTVTLPRNTPHESLAAIVEDRGLRHKDIAEIIGNKGLTTEILAGRREISKSVARKLADALCVPVDLFV